MEGSERQKAFQYYANISLSRTVLAGWLLPVLLYFPVCACMCALWLYVGFLWWFFSQRGTFLFLFKVVKYSADLSCAWFLPWLPTVLVDKYWSIWWGYVCLGLLDFSCFNLIPHNGFGKVCWEQGLTPGLSGLQTNLSLSISVYIFMEWDLGLFRICQRPITATKGNTTLEIHKQSFPTKNRLQNSPSQA